MAKFKGKVSRSEMEGGFVTLVTDEGMTYKLEGDVGALRPGVRAEVEGAIDGDQMGIGFGSQVLKVKKYKIL